MKQENKLIVRQSDYNLLARYIYARLTPLSMDFKNAEQLYEELQAAEIYPDEQTLPADRIGINSWVEVEEKKTKRRMKFRIVLPDKANFKKQQLSVYAPLSIALIGYKLGESVTWDMPSGQKTFEIKNVMN